MALWQLAEVVNPLFNSVRKQLELYKRLDRAPASEAVAEFDKLIEELEREILKVSGFAEIRDLSGEEKQLPYLLIEFRKFRDVFAQKVVAQN